MPDPQYDNKANCATIVEGAGVGSVPGYTALKEQK